VDKLRAELRAACAQVNALSALCQEQSDEIEKVRQLAEQRYAATGNELTDVEQRMMMRIALIEEAKPPKKAEESAQTATGYVPWSERKRRVEQLNSDPTKYLKTKEAK